MSSTQEVGDIFGAGNGPANAMLRSPTVLIVAIGLWGMNLFFFRLFGINYKFVLMYDLLKEKKMTSTNSTNTTTSSSTKLNMNMEGTTMTTGASSTTNNTTSSMTDLILSLSVGDHDSSLDPDALDEGGSVSGGGASNAVGTGGVGTSTAMTMTTSKAFLKSSTDSPGHTK